MGGGRRDFVAILQWAQAVEPLRSKYFELRGSYLEFSTSSYFRFGHTALLSVIVDSWTLVIQDGGRYNGSTYNFALLQDSDAILKAGHVIWCLTFFYSWDKRF